MTDPVERVARWLVEISGLSADEPTTFYTFKGEVEYERWKAEITRAEKLIAKFTEQGIPIDKLLSGEMVAVPNNTAKIAKWAERWAESRGMIVNPPKRQAKTQ